MQSQNKSEVFSIIHKYHILLRKVGLKAAPEKSFFFLEKLNFLGQVISSEGIQPSAKRVKDLNNPKSPECKRDVIEVLGCLGFHSCYFKNLHVDSKTFYDLISDSTSFHWTEKHEKIFQMIKDSISEDTILAIPSTEYPFHIHMDSSNIGTGCFSIQQILRESGSSPSILVFLIKQNRKCLHSTENCVLLSQRYKITSITLMDLLFQYTCIVTINTSSTYGDARDNYLTASFDIS